MMNLTMHRLNDLSPRLRRYRMGVWLSIVAMVGLVVGAKFPYLLGFFWASLLVLIAVMIPLWEMVHRDEVQQERAARTEQRKGA